MEAERMAPDELKEQLRGSVELAPDEEIVLVPFGELKEGDELIGSDGRTTIVRGYDAHIPESMYVLETDSGIELKVSGNHLIYVVTANDRDLHRKRLADGKRLGRQLSAESIAVLQEVAESTEGKFGFIADFEEFLEPKSDELRSALVRIAESLGPVAESNLYVDDLGGREAPLFTAAIQNYDRRLFAQQLLSVLNIGKSRKLWPPIVGTVMTVGMLSSYDPEDIYIPDPPEVLEERIYG